LFEAKSILDSMEVNIILDCFLQL